MSCTWTKDANGKQFTLNVVCFDADAKDIVLISNGKCTRDHSTPELYALSHGTAGCLMEPSEAVALRVVAARPRRGRKAAPVVAWTYRAVRAAALTVTAKQEFPDVTTLSNCIGRV